VHHAIRNYHDLIIKSTTATAHTHIGSSPTTTGRRIGLSKTFLISMPAYPIVDQTFLGGLVVSQAHAVLRALGIGRATTRDKP